MGDALCQSGGLQFTSTLVGWTLFKAGATGQRVSVSEPRAADAGL